jgi:hypothetical protein
MKFLGALLVSALLAWAAPALAQNPATVKLCIPTSPTACAPVTASAPLPVTGSFSATLAGFTPNGNYTTLTATAASSASTALPAGTVVAFQNLSTVDVSCVLTAGASTATTNKLIVRGGATVYYTIGSNTTAACINQTGSASNVVGLAGGAGLGTAFGGGSGGGGGAITAASGSYASGALASGSIASGAMVDLGSQADAACGTATGTCSLIALQKYNNTATSGAIPAQTTNAVNIGAVMNAGSTYETIAASQTGQVLGGSGAIGDYLSHCVIYPTTTTPGVVTVFDDASAAGSNVIAFPGGASSVSNLAPIAIPVGAVSVTGEWRVTTGANLVVTCYGKFT